MVILGGMTTQTPAAEALIETVNDIAHFTEELAAARQRREEAMLACRRDGMTQIKIAKLAQVSQVYVSDLLRKAGMPSRRSSMLNVNLSCDKCEAFFEPYDDSVDVTDIEVLLAQSQAVGWQHVNGFNFCPSDRI